MGTGFELDSGFRPRVGGNFIVIQDYKPELLEKLTANQAISVTGLTEHTQGYAGGFPRRGAGETGGKGAVRIEGLLFTRRRLWSERGWNALPGI